MRGWFDLVSTATAGTNPPTCRAIAKKRLMGFEPTTFCMANDLLLAAHPCQSQKIDSSP
jgi:hypothetical protein